VYAANLQCAGDRCCRFGSTVAGVSVHTSTNVTENYINDAVQIILRNLMTHNNSIEINGIKYPVSIDMVFERDVPLMNGSMILADNVTACMYLAQWRGSVVELGGGGGRGQSGQAIRMLQTPRKISFTFLF